MPAESQTYNNNLRHSFYLRTDDIVSVLMPMKCVLIASTHGVVYPTRIYMHVSVEPILEYINTDGSRIPYPFLFLAFTFPNVLADIGRGTVWVDIYVNTAYTSGLFDERQSERVGVGTLHASMADAVFNRP